MSPVSHPVRSRLADLAVGAGGVAVATGVGLAGRSLFSAPDVVMLYLLAIVVGAFRRGWGAAVPAAALSVATYNFFFVPPFHTFAVADTRNVLTFVVLPGVGLAASALADRLRRQEADARARERHTAALLALTRATSTATDERGLAEVVAAAGAGRLAAGVAVVLRGPDGAPRLLARAGGGGSALAPDEARLAEAAWGGSGGAVAGGWRARAIPGAEGPLGALVLRDPAADADELTDAFALQAGQALARLRHAQDAAAASLRARAEELRAALLSTVSHDLRTPLAAITGAATALLDDEARIDPGDRRALLTSVRDEAGRLERLVTNLLEMTRIAAGTVSVRRAWVPVDEVVGAAFARVERPLGGHPTRVALAPDLPLVELDPVLFEHVLVNLLENAARHTPLGTPIEVAAARAEGGVAIVVRDAGPGFPEGDPAALFAPFVRGPHPSSQGSGLGLAICRGIVEAHGGTIRAQRPPGGGAAVEIVLPLTHEPPEVPGEAEEGA